MLHILRGDPGRKRKVLIVEDSEINSRFLSYIVGREYDVLTAANGREALDVLREQSGTVSLILLDLIMPVMDGYEFMNEYHSHSDEYGRAPVIVLTADREAEVEALRRGAQDFIPKPLDYPEVIMARIERSIALEEDRSLICNNERDPLTLLYTRNFFMEYVRQYDLADPEAPMDAAVIVLNRFYMLLDVCGRQFIRKVVKAISDEIRSILPRTGGLACRSDLGIFLLYLPHREDYDDICARLSKILRELTGNTRVTIHMGVYQNVQKSLDVEQRYERVVLLCYDNKNSYKNSCYYYSDEIHERDIFNERLIMMMDTALREKQFVVYYQPKYVIQGVRPELHSAEALVRWMHPDMGLISPGIFIPLFEENGLVHRLDRYVWSEAARQVRVWHDKYQKKIPVSVNVSRIDIYAPELEKELSSLLALNSLDYNDLLLEITESAYTDDSAQIIETAKKLREKGFKIEMDDFGTGYSSLSMLTSLPIDALKLDMSFIRKMMDSPRDRQLIRLILDIARFLSIPAIAEGVEREEQCQALKEMGCDLIQGYYFSKPLPPEDFEKLIEKELEAA
ncbi:putative bifunctional diguanylate cyclase/phosphodiesterase [Succinimonas sp.]|uniref:putative bifunctional diguanylate cyclase/phosphodiesterase n=1 Tax=Succinimonas sp. TaxID=1936151 RepID=UPI0038701E5A